MSIFQAFQASLGITAYLATAIGALLIARNELADWNDRRELRRQLREAPIPASQLPPRSNYCRLCNEREYIKNGKYGITYNALEGKPCPEDCEFKAERHLHVKCELCGAEYAMKG